MLRSQSHALGWLILFNVRIRRRFKFDQVVRIFVSVSELWSLSVLCHQNTEVTVGPEWCSGVCRRIPALAVYCQNSRASHEARSTVRWFIAQVQPETSFILIWNLPPTSTQFNTTQSTCHFRVHVCQRGSGEAKPVSCWGRLSCFSFLLFYNKVLASHGINLVLWERLFVTIQTSTRSNKAPMLVGSLSRCFNLGDCKQRAKYAVPLERGRGIGDIVNHAIIWILKRVQNQNRNVEYIFWNIPQKRNGAQ